MDGSSDESSIGGGSSVVGGTAGSPSRRWSDLGVRAISALVLVAVAISSARFGGDAFLVVWIAASVAVLWEWLRLTEGDAGPFRFRSGAFVLVAAGVLVRYQQVGWALGLIVLASVAQFGLAIPGKRGWACGGMLYAGTLVVAVTGLGFSAPFGARAILWLFATVWSTDVFAYFGGRLIGGRKLWPRVSPSKTWAGTICGVVAGSLIGTATAVHDLPVPSALVPILILSLVTAILAQAGDAFESAIKRRFGVKDSSRLIPGHGGVMDRLDGFIAAAVFAFVFGLSRNLPSIASGLFSWA